MCGVVATAGSEHGEHQVRTMLDRIQHRGPDGEGTWSDREAAITLGHRRLSIIDLSSAGQQPMVSADGRYVLAFNGEVYNYQELRQQLADYPFRSLTDTEVVLAAWAHWGVTALDRLFGMFAFLVWDRRERTLIAVRDRLGIKPLYFASLPDGALVLASEIKALHAAGVPAIPDETAWATYLSTGQSDSSARTFWSSVRPLPSGCVLRWSSLDRAPKITRWYDLSEKVGLELDERDDATIRDEYVALLRDSVQLRFRADVPVGINLSGGLDSSMLLGLVHSVRGSQNGTTAFTFTCGDARYDELPWVEAMLRETHHPLVVSTLHHAEVPELAASIARASDEPYGGISTLAYAALFRAARSRGVTVLLDGQGLDEQWAGYDYYRSAADVATTGLVQGTRESSTRPECLSPAFAALAEQSSYPTSFPDRVRNLQLRDTLYTKLPRALRFNDRVSMAASTELREPFLDHRLFELALRQPEHRKIADGVGKVFIRDLARTLVPSDVRLAPKRALQTPQREWLRGPLRAWATELIEGALAMFPDWLDSTACRRAWHHFADGYGDNSFWIWQWISLGLIAHTR